MCVTAVEWLATTARMLSANECSPQRIHRKSARQSSSTCTELQCSRGRPSAVEGDLCLAYDPATWHVFAATEAHCQEYGNNMRVKHTSLLLLSRPSTSLRKGSLPQSCPRACCTAACSRGWGVASRRSTSTGMTQTYYMPLSLQVGHWMCSGRPNTCYCVRSCPYQPWLSVSVDC